MSWNLEQTFVHEGIIQSGGEMHGWPVRWRFFKFIREEDGEMFRVLKPEFREIRKDGNREWIGNEIRPREWCSYDFWLSSMEQYGCELATGEAAA